MLRRTGTVRTTDSDDASRRHGARVGRSIEAGVAVPAPTMAGLQSVVGNRVVARQAMARGGAPGTMRPQHVQDRPGLLAQRQLLLRHGAPEEEPLEVQALHDPAIQRHGMPEDEPLEVQAFHDTAAASPTTLRSREATAVLQRRGAIVQRVDTGIAKGKALDKYASEIKKIQPQWATLTSDGRAAALGKAANARLKDAGVLPCTINVKAFAGGTNGQLSFTTWTIDINSKLVNAAAITDEELANVADTMYHEARHAEQWFRIARWLAGTKGKTAEEITAAMQIPANVAAAAAKAGLKESTKFAKKFMGKEALALEKQMLKEAAAWHKNIYGTGGAARNKTLNNLDPTGKAYTDAKKAYDDKYTDAIKANNSAEADYLKANETFEDWDTQHAEALAAYSTAVTEGKPTFADMIKVAALNMQRGVAEATKDAALAKWQEKWDAMTALKKNLDDATTAAIEAHNKYKALVEEADAWALGDRVQQAMAKKEAKKK